MSSAEQQFDAFYTARFRPLAAQIAVYLGDRSEAEDITQEAFCRAWRQWSAIGADGDPIGWLHTVAYRLAASRWRRLKVALAHRHRQRPLDVAPPDPARVDLMDALAGLPDAQRRAIVLHYLADLSVEDIAGREGVATGTVKSWLHRGRGRLATALRPAAPAAPVDPDSPARGPAPSSTADPGTPDPGTPARGATTPGTAAAGLVPAGPDRRRSDK